MLSRYLALARHLERLGVSLDQQALAGLEHYERLILNWNRRINLISRRDEDNIVEHHFADSLGACPLVPTGSSVCDLGSGAGLPGIPIRIARPDTRLVLVESIRKKALFLEVVVQALGLTGTSVRNLRAEHIEGERFDIVLARHIGSVARVAALARHLLAEAGRLIVYKSQTGREEVEAARATLERLRLVLVTTETFPPLQSGRLRRCLLVFGPRA